MLDSVSDEESLHLRTLHYPAPFIYTRTQSSFVFIQFRIGFRYFSFKWSSVCVWITAVHKTSFEASNIASILDKNITTVKDKVMHFTDTELRAAFFH